MILAETDGADIAKTDVDAAASEAAAYADAAGTAETDTAVIVQEEDTDPVPIENTAQDSVLTETADPVQENISDENGTEAEETTEQQTIAIEEITVLNEEEQEGVTILSSDEESSANVSSGSCGEHATWSLDENGVLTISGTGTIVWSWENKGTGTDYPEVYDIKEIIIKDGITEFGTKKIKLHTYGSFAKFKDLEKITIPDSVTKIGDYAFSNCSSLRTIELPPDVTSIGDSAFYNCSSLETIELPSGVTNIGKNAFENCSSLKTIELPSGVTSIGNRGFYGCSSLRTIELPSGVTSIGESAFSNCSSLRTIELPPDVTSIGNYIFYYCSSLETIELPSGVTSIGDNAFDSCSSLRTIELPSGVNSIANAAFQNCSSLQSITIPDSVTSIGSSVFYKCSSLTDLTLPMRIKRIESQTFAHCTQLRNIVIPNQVNTIKYEAFQGCSNLTSITIQASNTTFGMNVFESCTSLKIYGYAGSQAETYAKSNNLTFIDLKTAGNVETVIGALPSIDEITLADKSAVQTARAYYEGLEETQKSQVSSETVTKLTAAEAAISRLEIQKVTDAIKALPSEITYSDKTSVKTANKCYTALTEEQKERVGSECSEKLTAALQKMAELEAEITAVKAAIDAIPNLKRLTYADKASVKNAEALYAALSAAQVSSISTNRVNRLTKAVEKIEGMEKLNAANTAIVNLPELSKITLNDKAAIEAAKTVYDMLTDEQKAEVSDKRREQLSAAVQKIVELETDLKAAEDEIRQLLSRLNLSEITMNDKGELEAAKELFQTLSWDCKEHFSEELLEKMNLADQKIAELETQLKSVQEIITDLPQFSDITLKDKTAIEAVKTAYDALTDEQKSQISDEIKAQLNAAIQKIADLEKAEKEKEEQQKQTEQTEHTHSYGEWKTTSKATVFAPEIQTRTCACKASETQTVGKKLTAVLELPGKLKSFSIRKDSSKTIALTMANGDSVKSVKSSAAKTLKATLNKKTGKLTLKALKTGTAKLTISLASGKSKTYTVKVTNSTIKTTALSVTSVKNKKLTLAKGKTHTLKTEVKPFTSTQKVTYTSSNKKVATVTSAGKIKAVAAGKATITAKSGSKSVKITVTVPGITLAKTSVSVKKGKTLTLSPKLYGISGKAAYTSSNKKVAAVTTKGKIKGIKKGTAKITIKAGGYKKTVTVKVK